MAEMRQTHSESTPALTHSLKARHMRGAQSAASAQHAGLAWALVPALCH